MKVCESLLKTNLFKIYNSLKNIEYSLYGFSTTEIFYRNFELTNQRRGREDSNLKIGPTLDQILAKFGPNFEVLATKNSSKGSNGYFLSDS